VGYFEFQKIVFKFVFHFSMGYLFYQIPWLFSQKICRFEIIQINAFLNPKFQIVLKTEKGNIFLEKGPGAPSRPSSQNGPRPV
jgi:hypothetical protein